MTWCAWGCSRSYSQAAQVDTFSAGKVIAKMYLAQERMRIEPQNMTPRNAPPIAYIMYLNTQTQFMLLLRERVYAKIPPQENWWMYTAFRGDVENVCRTWGKASHSQSDTCRKVGDDTINGRTALKYEGHCSQGQPCFIWIDRRLRFMLKWENGSQGEELRNIQEGSQPINMFEVPPGFKSVQSTTGTIHSGPRH